ncbi:hypothetical protein [Streptomyces sp. NPDC059916]|uniref:hypothetical protein n=1 Tax=Streptomyces sp. NPDC059916 TaxID=3347001 RepID=UPI0036AD61CC
MAGSQPAFFSELFHPRVRYTGVASASARELGATVGGLTPLAATALLAAYSTGLAVAALVIVMCLISVASVVWAPETRGRRFDIEIASEQDQP